MHGNLALHGLTQPLTLEVRFGGAVADPFGNARLAFHASGAITRTDFGLTHELENEAGSTAVRNDVGEAQVSKASRGRS